MLNKTQIAVPFSHLIGGLNAIGTLWIFLLMVVINTDVFSRLLFNHPIDGVPELIELSIVGIVFLQLCDTVRAGRLTRSDGLFVKIVSKRPKLGHVLGFIYDIAGAVLMALIILGGVPRLIEAYERDYYTGTLGLFTAPVWPINLILVVGCFVTALQFLIQAMQHVASLRESVESAT